MKQRIICLLAAACLLLLTGCETGGGGSITTKPNFNTNSTPQQILTAAVEKTALASSFQLTRIGEEETVLTVTLMKNGKNGYIAMGQYDCGCHFYVSGSDRVHLQCQTAQVTREDADTPYTLQQILEELPAAETGIWERFSQFPVMAELLGDGSTRYGVQEMRYCDMCYLLDGLYPPGSNGDPDDFGGYFFATVDASGYLTGIEFKSANLKNPIDYSIKIEKLNQKMTIETPWWAE